MRKLIHALREALQVEDAVDGEYVGPDEYRGIIGKCPDTWNFDGKSCQQVRPGPKKFRIGSFEPEIRDKLRAAKKDGAEKDGAKAEPAAKKPEEPARKKRVLPENPIAKEATVPPPNGKTYDVDPRADADKDGVTDAARVGLCGTCVAPPPAIPRLPNLTADEREVEGRFASAFEEDPMALVDEYLDRLAQGKIGDAPNVFSTDDAKLLSPDYNPSGSDADKKDAMGRYNVVVHQTANAIAKKAFLKKLDELAALPEGDPKRSVLMTNGGVACHGEDTPILMFDGSVRMVQDIAPGEQVMGPDSKPRVVLVAHRGLGDLYNVVPKRGASFVVNDEHVLSLKEISRNGTNPERQRLRTVNIKVKDVLARGKRFAKNSWLYRTGVEFAAAPVPLDPYFLGLWLGDGTHSLPAITSADPEIAAFMESFAATFPGIRLVVHAKKSGGLSRTKDNKSSSYQLSKVGKMGMRPGRLPPEPNPVTKLLSEIGVLHNKHIPASYLINSQTVRLGLLAGLLDSDGYLDKLGGYEITTKDAKLAETIAFLGRSLGFGVTQALKRTRYKGESRAYHRLHVAGDVDRIPVRVERKKSPVRRARTATGRRNRDTLHTGYALTSLGKGAFFGFTLDGDGLYLLGDFTVTHNSGKGYALGRVDETKALAQQVGAIWDSAGEQNGTEAPWVLEEAKKRGLKSVFVFVDSDPKETWANPKRGVIERAKKTGRMVDARVFADSYAIGARNFQAMSDKHKGDKDAEFFVLSSREGAPQRVPAVPEAALKSDEDDIYQQSLEAIHAIKDLPPAIKRGGTISQRIWRPE